MTRVRLEDLPPQYRDQARAQLGGPVRGPTPETSPAAVPRETTRSVSVSKRGRYGIDPVTADGETFGSKWELKRYRELQEQLRAGLIEDLRHHVSFPLHVMTPTGDRARIAAYEADFVYRRGEQLVVEDTKGEATRATPIYRRTAAHFEAEYALKVLDVVRVRRKRRDREVRR